jgi:hypothetical protein
MWNHQPHATPSLRAEGEAIQGYPARRKRLWIASLRSQ